MIGPRALFHQLLLVFAFFFVFGPILDAQINVEATYIFHELKKVYLGVVSLFERTFDLFCLILLRYGRG